MPAIIAKVRKWTAKQRLEKIKDRVTMMADGTAFMSTNLDFEVTREEHLELIACASFAPKGLPYVGQYIQADVQGCEACKHHIVHKGYIQCGHPEYNEVDSLGMAMGSRIAIWQDAMSQQDAFNEDGSLDEAKAGNRRCPGWSER